ncbi:GNAT family N-acetyltransferase [Vibrio nitrifigilis]|uniref:GNAT family N-acetyltransferase n=1 Tax=Vibrio nitrifigilis TaxID=2789781 RepID=A0ABS0GIF9_9VIBR|nr:GNAT family N-acetyltransferase [Vibrio nitrifigilis]MBF9002220.1 GNAT family N-acetyltransferase [Vibrio nitrifigilis]
MVDATATDITYQLRPMDNNDLESAYQLTQNLHWPHRREDWATMLKLSHTVGLEIDGKLVGTACSVVQGQHASIGLIVVADEYQGLGLGRRLMEAITQLAGQRHLFLTATVAGKPLYEKLGFHVYGRIKQFQGNAKCPTDYPSGSLSNELSLRQYQTSDHDSIIELMNSASKMERTKVAEEIFEISEEIVLLEKNHQLQGFAAFRPFGRGYAIGPVVAQNQSEATTLIESILAKYQGRFIRIDTPIQFDLEPMLLKWNLQQADDVTLMSLGPHPYSEQAPYTYGVVTQAIG